MEESLLFNELNRVQSIISNKVSKTLINCSDIGLVRAELKTLIDKIPDSSFEEVKSNLNHAVQILPDPTQSKTGTNILLFIITGGSWLIFLFIISSKRKKLLRSVSDHINQATSQLLAAT